MRQFLVRALCTLALLVAGLVVGAVPGHAAGAFCSLPGLHTVRWDGGGDGVTWDQGLNWSTDQVPGLTPGGGTDYVCIDNAGSIVMDSNRAEVVALDIRASTVTLLNNSQVFVYGNQTNQPSTIRGTAIMVMSGSNAIGGSGRIDLLGKMHITSSNGFANTLVSRICGIGNTCPSTTGTPGLLTVGDTATLFIDGGGPATTDLGGVNLKDQYQIDVTGKVTMSKQGFISADYGTRTRLLPRATGVGQFIIANNGGYYEGSSVNGLTTLSTFINNGLILKSGGTGTSVITATYSAPSGGVTVNKGTVVLPDGPVTPATVAAGTAVGSGSCVPGSTLACKPVTTPDDQQIATVQLAAADTNGASVAFSLIAPATVQDVGNPVEVTTNGLQATASDPALLTFRYDASVLGGQRLVDLQIFRKEGTAAYTQVSDCLSAGQPSTGQNACVDRRGIAGTSSRNLSDGDVVVVVRTQSTSRWVAR